jgi:hypothetical protein
MQIILLKILAKAMSKWRDLIGREIHVTAVQPAPSLNALMDIISGRVVYW